MKVSTITVRVNKAWAEYQHVRVEFTVKCDKADDDIDEVRKQVVDLANQFLDEAVTTLRAHAVDQDKQRPEDFIPYESHTSPAPA
jgi:oligoribonuclease (3'-5' exoribonuclease)